LNTDRPRWLTSAATAGGVLALTALIWWGWKHPLMQTWIAEASPIPFFAAMALLPALGVPIGPFFVLAGAAFGIRLGLVGSAAALGVNLLLCYRIGRGRLRRMMARLLGRLGYSLPSFDGRRTGAARFTLLVKLTPGLPAFAKNYLLGLAGVPLRMYFIVGMAVTGTYGAALVILGESAFHHDLRRLVVPALVIALAGIGVWIWRRKQRDRARTA
jgi:uncharacterized membrane protein YdjX (TVP38/TMEM64 family)